MYRKIGSVTNPNPARSYWFLSEQLYKTPFKHFVPNDDNRAADGKALRETFLSGRYSEYRDEEWCDLECSILEMMIALAQRATFEVYEEIPNNTPGDWFHRLIANLDLTRFNDEAYLNNATFCTNKVHRVITRMNDREYNSDGMGGLFPLRHPRGDQTEIEIWYQMSAYLMEMTDER